MGEDFVVVPAAASDHSGVSSFFLVGKTVKNSALFSSTNPFENEAGYGFVSKQPPQDIIIFYTTVS